MLYQYKNVSCGLFQKCFSIKGKEVKATEVNALYPFLHSKSSHPAKCASYLQYLHFNLILVVDEACFILVDICVMSSDCISWWYRDINNNPITGTEIDHIQQHHISFPTHNVINVSYVHIQT